ncbi:MAG: GntR family transcriptional regulator [Nocardioides sp.]
MTTSSEYVRPQTAQQAALREIRRWLLAGKLKPGDQVIQDVVAGELGVSVVPIREALKTLESEGQLKYIPQRGFFVNELSREELLELCDIRSALETMAVDRALPHVSQSDIKEMRDLITRMEAADKAGDVVEMIRLDRRFHFIVFEAAGLNQLTRIITLTWDQSDPYRAAFFNDPGHRAANHPEHRKILAAVRKRDAAGVSALLDEHRLGPVRRLSHLVEDEKAGTTKGAARN